MYHVDLNDAEIGLLISLLQTDCVLGAADSTPSTYEIVTSGEKTNTLALMCKLIDIRTARMSAGPERRT